MATTTTTLETTTTLATTTTSATATTAAAQFFPTSQTNEFSAKRVRMRKEFQIKNKERNQAGKFKYAIVLVSL